MAAVVHFPCSTCGEVQQLGLDGAGTVAACPRCGTATQLARRHPGRQESCALCGGTALYVQRDFNRKLGLGIVVVAAALLVPTRGISLLAAVLLDLLLYRALPRITVCYACDAVHRGVPVHPGHGAFNPHVADDFKEERAQRQAAVRQWRLAHARREQGERQDTESRKRSSNSGG